MNEYFVRSISSDIYRPFRSYKVVLLVIPFSVSIFCCFKTRKVFLSQILHQVLTSIVCSLITFPHVHPWQIHVDVWQNQYSIVK